MGEPQDLPPPISISAIDVQSFADMKRMKKLQLCAGWINPEGHLETKAVELYGLDTSPIEAYKVVPK